MSPPQTLENHSEHTTLSAGGAAGHSYVLRVSPARGCQRSPGTHRYRQKRAMSSSIDGKVQAEIMDRCEHLHASFIQPLNDNAHGPLEKLNTGGYQSTKMPFVFVLGNHSSGKSSFINYVLGRNIQTAGVAPTDDRCVFCVAFPLLFQDVNGDDVRVKFKCRMSSHSENRKSRCILRTRGRPTDL